MVTVGKLMTPRPVTIDSHATVREATKLMRERKIGSLFVDRVGHIEGILTEADIVRKVVGAELDPASTAVGAVMSSPLIGIDERRPITEAADLMDQHKTRHLAVTKSGSVVGVLSVRDLLHPVSIDEF